MKTEGGTSCQKHLISIFPPLVIVAEYIGRSFNQKCGNKIRVGNKKGKENTQPHNKENHLLCGWVFSFPFFFFNLTEIVF